MENTTSTSAAVVDTPSTTSTDTSVSSTPATTTTAPTRPSSMQEALEQASQSADTGDAAPQSASAAMPNGSVAPPQGPIPFEVHHKALENARTKATTEALRGISPEQFNQMLGWYQRAAQDTTGFLTETLASHPQAIEVLTKAVQTLQAHPTYGPQLKSLAARALASARGGTSAPKPPAMVQVQLEDGSTFMAPRDPSAFLAYHQSQWEQQVGKQLSPLQETVQSLKAEHDAAVHQAQVDQFVHTTVDDIQKWPGVDKEAMTAIAQEIQHAPIDWNDAQAISHALNVAYRKVVVPTLSSKAQSTYAASLKQKAAAQIETASTRAASPTAKPKNVSQLASLLAQLEAGGR